MLRLTPLFSLLHVWLIQKRKMQIKMIIFQKIATMTIVLPIVMVMAYWNEDCDDENPWVSEDCRRTCTGDFEILSDDDLPQVAGCSVINGSLDIEGLTQTDLLALNQLENVTGSLLIMNNEALESTTGLNNLTNVGEDLLISFNDALMNLNGLDSVQSVGNTLSLSNSSSLSNIQGLSGLASVGSSILLNNIPIADLKGFENLQIIGSSLYISDCTEITLSLYRL